ncbi:MAG: macro domain-containing protein [Planctomycetota bacterium]
MPEPRVIPLSQTDAAAAALEDPVRRIELVRGDPASPDPAWGIDALAVPAADAPPDRSAHADPAALGSPAAALHRAAGPRLRAHLQTLGPCATGLAHATPAYDLEAHGVQQLIHAAVPVWPAAYVDPDAHAMPGAPLGDAAQLGYLHEDTLLASCHLHALRLAVAHGVCVLGFAPLTAGDPGFPAERAAKIAFGHVFGHFAQRPAPDLPHKVLFVCSTDADAAAYRQVIQTRADWMTRRRRV